MPDTVYTPDGDDTLKPGEARCPGTSWDNLAAADSRPVPEFLKGESYEYMGSEPLAASRYTSPEFFRQEVEKMWPNVWQFAAREEELPEPGDNVVYENVGRSYLIVRQQDGSVKAFYNVCLHRGRKLRTESGWAEEIKCPFHGFSWNTDGSLKNIPCRWDFPHLKDEKMSLPEVSVGQWAGYIFIREATEGPTLEEYLAPLPKFFSSYHHEQWATVIWVGKVIHANWKVVQEAFMEAWHSVETHPQILAFTGDANSRYNVYGDNVNLAVQPMNVLSPHLDPEGKSQQWIVDSFLRYAGRAGGEGMSVKVPEGNTARQAMAAENRHRYAEDLGYDYEAASDSEMIDALTFNVFPNFAPWAGFAPSIVYRWRPWPDENSTLMETRILMRVPKGTKAPRSVEMRLLKEDELWTAAPELGALGDVFEQDMYNLPEIQQGLKASKTGEINLGNYQEIRIRHFHRTLDKYLRR